MVDLGTVVGRIVVVGIATGTVVGGSSVTVIAILTVVASVGASLVWSHGFPDIIRDAIVVMVVGTIVVVVVSVT